MTSKELGISLPRRPVSAGATIQPLSPDPNDTPIELQKALRVCRAAVVPVVASELGVEGLLLLVHHFGNGVVFKLAPNSDGTWSETVLHSFHGRPDGAYPFVGVTFDPRGDLYGTITQCGIGGGNFGGIVYKLTPTSTGWVECLVHSFESNGF